jgi:succinate dehydrogenase / fumarate reductase flavoprotein subunit
VVLCTGGYSPVYFLSTNAVNCNATAIWRCHKRGAYFANPCFTQIHPTCIPQAGSYQSKLTLMSESLRNDGRVWVPRSGGDTRKPADIPEDERYYYLEERYPAFGNLVPRDIASRAAKAVCDEGRGVGTTGYAVYLDFADAIARLGSKGVADRYGNLFSMYEEITGEDPYHTPMRIYPAPHYTMGGLWVDYGLMSTIPGLFVAGEANFSDHGANRLGASALMQGLADGYFVIPATVPHYLATSRLQPVGADAGDFRQVESEVREGVERFLSMNGSRTVRDIHTSLGEIMLDRVGMSRSAEGLQQAIVEIAALREEFWSNLKTPGRADDYNKDLEFAGRVADYLELGELMARDALLREESCGGHFREEHQSPEGEALRDDDDFAFVAAWEYGGPNAEPRLRKEHLHFDNIHLATRSYK